MFSLLFLFMYLIVYKDLLAVTATSKSLLFEFCFSDESTLNSFQNFLQTHLQMNVIAKSIEEDIANDDDAIDSFSEYDSKTVNLKQNEMYYSAGDGYWRGTLLRSKEVLHLKYQMKFYSG